jgi:transposase
MPPRCSRALATQAKAVIPSTAARKVPPDSNRYQYRDRNVVERFFAKLRQLRRVAAHYDYLIT